MMQEFVQQIKKLMRDMIDQVHTALPGTIVSFDPTTCQATVLPAGKFRKPDGKTMDFPEITGVPVMFQQASGQDAAIVYPIKSGDGCLLIISEQSLDYWMYGSESKTDLKFDLTSAIAIPGLCTEPNSVVAEACAEDAIIIDKCGTRITCKKDEIDINQSGTSITLSQGKIAIRGDVTIEGDVSIIGKLDASQSVEVDGSISSGGSICAVQDVTAGAISLQNHTHGGVMTGSGNTGRPQ